MSWNLKFYPVILTGLARQLDDSPDQFDDDNKKTTVNKTQRVKIQEEFKKRGVVS